MPLNEEQAEIFARARTNLTIDFEALTKKLEAAGEVDTAMALSLTAIMFNIQVLLREIAQETQS